MIGDALEEERDLVKKRHNKEARELEGKIRALLKTVKKTNKTQIEAQVVQMENDLKTKHNEENESMEKKFGKF